MNTHAYDLRSEQSLVNLFYELAPCTDIQGVYFAELPGPRFLVPIKLFVAGLFGLPGWKGKHFLGETALNMLESKSQLRAGPLMHIKTQAHRCDGREGLVAVYDDRAPFLWRHCVDEFRQLDDHTILGMSHFDIPGMKGKPSMFLLHHNARHPGVVPDRN